MIIRRSAWSISTLCFLLLLLLGAPCARSVGVAPVGVSAVGVPCEHLAGNAEAEAAYRRGLTEFYQGHIPEAAVAFRDATRLVPSCALSHAALSRALLAEGHSDPALREGTLADGLTQFADTREQLIVRAWASHLKASQEKGAAAAKDAENERTLLDFDIALYPDDVDLWAYRGDAADNPIRAAPYRLYLLKLNPEHPLNGVWKCPVTQVPTLKVSDPLATHLNYQPKLFDGLGNVSFPITGADPLVQRYFEQGMRCFHCYVTSTNILNSAGQCFAFASTLDPKCAMAQWGLTFCLEKKDVVTPLALAQSAYSLAMDHGTDKERRYCAARLLELSGPEHRTEFLDTLDGAICAYPDDIELWIWRGKVYGAYVHTGDESANGVSVEKDPSVQLVAGMPFEIAAQRMHPEHPSPNHELIHDYEGLNRPELGWQYVDPFRADAPNMPHAQHMRAHLAMRLGRWAEALEAANDAWKKAQEGYPELDPGHHLYVRLICLAHEGQFKELIKSTPAVLRDLYWPRMLRLKADEAGLVQWVQQHAKQPTPTSLYVAALVDLDQGKVKEAGQIVHQLEPFLARNSLSSYDFNEAKARYLIASGKVEDGLQVFRQTAAVAINDGNLHFFGQGGYFPEVWGEACLRIGRWEEAELAFSEALAHDHGSVVGALGMQVVFERTGRADMAKLYALQAADIWKRADPGSVERQFDRLRGLAQSAPKGKS